MLEKGKFVKEKPPKIGSNYFPVVSRQISDEENFMQQVFLGSRPDHMKKEINVALWVVFIYIIISSIAALFGISR